ncbi:MAG: heavy-metal-associated domain-containing protein [Chloroflexi bacterium]|nr:heavy-metal-associated domain-containing protein [Chloroflexota bacterium]
MKNNKGCYVAPHEKLPDTAAFDGALRAHLEVVGMGCINCAHRVRNGLLETDGVMWVQVSFKQGWAEVVYDPQRVTTPVLLDAVARIGRESSHNYEARLIATRSASRLG